MISKILAAVLVLIAILLGWDAYQKNFASEVTFEEREHGRFKIFISGETPKKQIAQLEKTSAESIGNAEKRTGLKFQKPVTIYVYNSLEEKGKHSEDIQYAHSEPLANKIYVVSNSEIDGFDEHLEYELLLHQNYGSPVSMEWSRAIAAGLSDFWFQKPLNFWRDFLLERNLFNLSEPMDPHRSRFINVPKRGLIVRELLKKKGPSFLKELYTKGTLPADSYEIPVSKPVQQPAKRIETEFHKGMSYAYTNDAASGYATELSAKSLDELKKLGVTHIASIPYGFMRGPDSEVVKFAGTSAYTESDESLIDLAQKAKTRGMKVMLKPQIWISHHSWPGNVNFASEEAWSRWFQSYEDWIVHYAIVAELTDANLFCIGTEFVQATLKHPASWEKMIGRIRQVYHGPLVYAANWGKEFEGITFWGSLDYLGLDNYYPVRRNLQHTPAEIEAAFRDQKKMLSEIVERYKKPLLFTEAGYMAIDGAGMGSQEKQHRGYNEEIQAVCYEGLMRAYWDEPWFAGFYWWKWFSDPRDRGKKADEFSIHERKAEAILKSWYTKKR